MRGKYLRKAKLASRLILALVVLLALSGSARAQEGRYETIEFDGSGRLMAGVNVAVCTTLATSAASVTNNIATLTMVSNPQTAGFLVGFPLTVSGFSGADTYLNTTATIIAVSSTTISYTLVHANASATSNGLVYMTGSTTQACAPLATLYTDNTGNFTSPNPFVSDGLGNVGIWAVPAPYFMQTYGPTVVTSIRQIGVPCVPGTVGATCGGAFGKVVNVAAQIGATADVKFANACTQLPAGGGILDATGFGPTFQTIASTVQCGGPTKPVTTIFDQSTVYQPSASSTNMFQFSQQNAWNGLNIDTTNFPTYSGNPISNASQPITWFYLENMKVNMASGSTGPCMNINATNVLSNFVDFGTVWGFQCFGGTAANGINLSDSTGGFLNSVTWVGVRVYNTQYGVAFNQAGLGSISGHTFSGYYYEASGLSTALAAIYMNATGHNGGNDLSYNTVDGLQVWDPTAGNGGVIVTAGSNGFACANKFSGRLIFVNISDSSCAAPNEVVDTSGSSTGTQEQLGYVAVRYDLTLPSPSGRIVFSNNRPLSWKDNGGTANTYITLDASNNLDILGHPTLQKIIFQPNPGSVGFFMTGGGEFGGGATNATNPALFSIPGASPAWYIKSTDASIYGDMHGNIFNADRNNSAGGYQMNGVTVIDHALNFFSSRLNQTSAGKYAGTCTMSAGTTCTSTISVGYSGAPICFADVQSTTLVAGSCALSGTTVTVTAGAANSSTWGWLLIGNPQ
jgi:hypothetical protein